MSHADTCPVCWRDPATRNNAVAECSHVDCPHRRHCWSERPQPIPAPTRRERDPQRALIENQEE